jgi:hypothetical protein
MNKHEAGRTALGFSPPQRVHNPASTTIDPEPPMTPQTQLVPGSIESYALERNHILDLVEQIADMAEALPATDRVAIGWRHADALKRIRQRLSGTLEEMNRLTF